MKKLILIILVVLQFGFINAQTSSYIPYPDNGVWYSRSQTMDPINEATYAEHRTEIHGDTVIGGINYYKYYNYLGSIVLIGAMRNDTLNKKVYFLNFSTGIESLFLNFNLNVGDTLGFGGDDTLWVYDIDSVYLGDSLYHNRYRIKGNHMDSINMYNPPGQYFPSELIEGIGYRGGEKYGHINGPEYSYSIILWCVNINSIRITKFGFGNYYTYCDSYFSVGTEEKKNEEKCRIFPNPNNGKFEIIVNSRKINTIEITDVLGNLILKSEINKESILIDLSDKLNGIYFVKIIDSKENIVVKKVVKQ